MASALSRIARCWMNVAAQQTLLLAHQQLTTSALRTLSPHCNARGGAAARHGARSCANG